MSSRTLDECWNKTEEWLELNAEYVHSSLSPPASLEVLALAEEYYQSSLPSDLIELYNRHDGQSLNSSANLFYGQPYLAIEYGIGMHQGMIVDFIDSMEFSKFKLIHEEIDSADNSPISMFPIAGGTDTEAVFVDLNPSMSGTFGQVLFIDIASRIAIKVADSVTDMVCKFHTDLQKGNYAYTGGVTGNLQPSKELDLLNWAFHNQHLIEGE